ncbi:MAG: glycerophosphodiester phosphodiesterase [Burkholderiales bacterium]
MNRFFALLFLVPLSHSATAIDVHGHRGARGHLPENTLPGFERALQLGATTLELDVGVTRDGVVVVHHDRALNPDTTRGPDGQWIAAPGLLIRELTYAQLQRYDVGRIRPGSEYAKRFPHQQAADGARVPRLAELLLKAARFNIETKLSAEAPHEALPPEPFARAVVAEVRKAGAAARTTIQSFDWRTLKVVEREAPEIATAYLTGRRNAQPEAVHAAGGRIWSPEFTTLTPQTLAAARRLGLKLVPWTVNEPADIARVLDMQVEGIISDYPDRVRAALKARGIE